jgi:uncharacterized membrane protein
MILLYIIAVVLIYFAIGSFIAFLDLHYTRSNDINMVIIVLWPVVLAILAGGLAAELIVNSRKKDDTTRKR